MRWLIAIGVPVLLGSVFGVMLPGPWNYAVGFALGCIWGVAWSRYWWRKQFERFVRETDPRRNGK